MKRPTTQEIANALAGGLNDDANSIELGDLQKALDGQDIHFTAKSRRRNRDLHLDIRRHQHTRLVQTAESVRSIIEMAALLLDLKKEFAASTIVLLDILEPISVDSDDESVKQWLKLHQSNREWESE